MLVAVARLGSFNAAAHELGLTQQAVSARVAATEALVGVRLVDRGRRGSSLTGEGAVVAEWAERVLAAAGELEAGIQSLRADRNTRLRVSASLTIAEQLLPLWLVSFRTSRGTRGAEQPQIILTAANSEHVVEQVRDGSAELGFIEGPSVPRQLRSRTVAHDELVLVVEPNHPWARRRQPVTADELSRTPLVSREEGSGTSDFLGAALRTVLGPNVAQTAPVLSLSTGSAVRAAVRAGAGPAVLSELTVADDIAAHRLVRVPVAGIQLRRPLRVVWTGPAQQPPPGPGRDLVGHILVQRRSS
jgi:molybdate transport repressor ModE-like protein